jgi:hypothetical protein
MVIPVNCPGFCSGFLSADLIFERRSPVVARLSRAVVFTCFSSFHLPGSLRQQNRVKNGKPGGPKKHDVCLRPHCWNKSQIAATLHDI